MKLTRKQIADIKRSMNMGDVSQKDINEELGFVTPAYLSNILNPKLPSAVLTEEQLLKITDAIAKLSKK